MLKREDRPFLYALAAIAFALLLNVAAFSALADQPQEQTTTGRTPDKNTAPGEAATWNADDTIAVFTTLTFFVFCGQLWMMRRTDEHFQASEKPYLQMSHRSGLATAATGDASVQMQIRNWGKTPGTIIDRRLGVYVWGPGYPLPIEPPYDRIDITPVVGAFLVPTGVVNFDGTFKVNPETMAAVNNREVFLVVFGYVDYEDKFGGTHRSGYARQFVPNRIDSKNLVFITGHRYNFDRRID